jgi:Matrixin
VKTIAICACLLLLTASGASAYVLFSPNRTWDCPPTYTVDDVLGGVPSIFDTDHGVTRLMNAITSLSAWNGAGSGRLIKAVKGNVSGFTLGDGKPMLKLSDPIGVCSGGCLAATFVGYYHERYSGSGSWEIDDADIVMNSAGFNWTSQGEDPGGVGCSNEVYIEGVMVHEVGHALGLAHSPVSGATMASSSLYCNNTPATTEADDEAGLNALYGTVPCTACDTYTNHIPAEDDSQIQPCGTFFHAGSGTLMGYLTGPAGTDFDLFLYRHDGTTWVKVASATSTSPNETLTYNGLAGWYQWLVYSYSGSGTYHFSHVVP